MKLVKIAGIILIIIVVILIVLPLFPISTFIGEIKYSSGKTALTFNYPSNLSFDGSTLAVSGLRCFDDSNALGFVLSNNSSYIYYATTPTDYKRGTYTGTEKIGNSEFHHFEQKEMAGALSSSGPVSFPYHQEYYVRFLKDGNMLEITRPHTSCGARKLGDEAIDKILSSIEMTR